MTHINTVYISKSKYLSGLQCEKLLWFQFNAKNQIPQIGEATQAIFDQGHEVGELAKRLYPGGIDVANGILNPVEVDDLSLRSLKARKPLFEAGFLFEEAFARIDILNPAGKDRWDIIEVKSSTKVENVHYIDVAFQRNICEKVGLHFNRCYLMHINSKYVRRGEIDPKQLFTVVDITEEVQENIAVIDSQLSQMAKIIALKKYPEIKIGPQCDEPYPCILEEICWKYLPEDNITMLYRYPKKKGFELIHKGILDIRDIPPEVERKENHEIQIQAVKSGKPYVDKTALTGFLKSLQYPLYFLDFETITPAIPLFDLVSPYEQIPFQFSLHILNSKDGEPEHHSFLAEGKTDPRPELLRRLKELLGTQGFIVAYNASFEKKRLKEACKCFPEYAKWFSEIEKRMIDLLEPFRSFYYYHPLQHGKMSIKNVLPALTGSGYENMKIKEGGTASREYLRVTFGDVDDAERQKVRKQLEEYCALDTMGMVRIVKELSIILK